MSIFDKNDALHLRNLVFGVEDGIVSTVGLLSGIAIADVPPATILLTGVVLIFVEAVSMAAGSFLSEASVDDLSGQEKTSAQSTVAGMIMFTSYFAAGFVPLLPYMFLEVQQAFPVSIIAALGALFVLGYWSGKGSRTPGKKAFRMMLVGGAAILVGVLAGSVLV